MASTDAHILVVEDSPTQAKEIAILLGSAGYKVDIVSKGGEALEFVAKHCPDLVILDVILPDMDGYTVCRRIRRSFKSYIPIMMLSQRSQVEDKVDGLEVGADDYLAKPFDTRELIARVHALLRMKGLQDDLQQKLEDERRAYERLRDMALKDPLTGVYNRYYFWEVLEKEFSTAQRYNASLGCAMADVDHFRRFNNLYGHAVGDWVLRSLASLLDKNTRKVDTVCRYGGEEFTILLPMSNIASTFQSAERLRRLVEENRWRSPAGELKLTISFGISAFPEVPVKTAASLIETADKALLEAKRKGRNRVEIFKPTKKEESDV